MFYNEIRYRFFFRDLQSKPVFNELLITALNNLNINYIIYLIKKLKSYLREPPCRSRPKKLKVFEIVSMTTHDSSLLGILLGTE